MTPHPNPLRSPFSAYHEPFLEITGPDPKLSLILENLEYPFAHEAGVFIPASNELFITSNQHLGVDGKTQIKISKVKLGKSQDNCTCEEIETENVPMANGGVTYKNGILFCAQGTLEQPGGIAYMETNFPYQSQFLIQSFYGRPFNSPNDVVVHSNGSIWFTDPIYGYEQGIRPQPQLPNQLYCFQPQIGAVRAMADGFGRPNGVCFSPDESILYITDTDSIHGDGSVDMSRTSTM